MKDKLTSGRFLLTVCAGLTFVWLACTGAMSAENATNIIIMVTTFYFAQRSVESPTDTRKP